MDYTVRDKKLVAILNKQVKPALGCTEPVAVALAVATAYRQIEGEVSSIDIELSPNILKNGLRVGIPGTKETGLEFASLLAVVCGNPELGLRVFEDVNDNDVKKAYELAKKKDLIDLRGVSEKGNFYIGIEIKTDQGTAKCIIKDNHTNVVYVEKNGEAVLDKREGGNLLDPNGTSYLKEMTIKELRHFIETVELEEIQFLMDGVRINMEIADYGLEHAPGLAVGAGIKKLIDSGVFHEDTLNKIKMYTAAASDARMAGINMPVMSSAGSGNHGITAIVPTTVYCREIGCNDEKLVRAIAFSHLVTSYIKEFAGKLSPVCGCAVAAGIGASVSIAWLMEATDEQIGGAIKNMVGCITGMACDGAKGGCAFKLATAASEAFTQAQLAAKGVVIGDYEGIVGSEEDTTIRNLGKFCMEGMDGLDDKIIEIMIN